MALSNVNFKINKLTDKDLIYRVSEVLKEQGMKVKTLTVGFFTGGNLNVNDPATTSNSELQEILDQNTEIASSFSFQAFSLDDRQHFTISVNRKADHPHDQINFSFDSLKDDQRPLANRVVGGMRKKLEAIDSHSVVERHLGDALSAQHKASEDKLQKLEGIASSLIYDQEKYRQQLEGNYQTRVDELKTEHDEKQAKLADREKELEVRLKDVDDRESRHARRALANSIKNTFQERSKKFNLSDGTVQLRRPIQYFTVALLVVLGGLFVVSVAASLKIFGMSAENSPEAILRQIGLGIAFASMTVFYLRWNNKWFEKHAEEEFLLKRQEIDIDRASWVVELSSEWLDRGREIPESLMDKLTANLFAYESKEVEPLHPADQLASAIFGASAKANVKLPNGLGELEFDRKSQKQLQRPLDH